MTFQRMTLTERRAAVSLASIMSLRMLGLFMILPVFSLYAHGLTHATPALIGLAMGIYGLTQGIFQIPFGVLSDHFGRRKIITIGLFIFTIGCVISALSESISGMIVGRALQGIGAVGSTIIAMLADLTREEQRSKAMAITGMTIGLSFSVAMILGPLFSEWINIFWLAALFGIAAIILLYIWVPTPPPAITHPDVEPQVSQFSSLLKLPELMRLNIGIFTLHVVLTASFVVLPLSLKNLPGFSGQQWMIYIPTLLVAFLLTIPLIMVAEKKRMLKPFFLGGVATLAFAELLLWLFSENLLLSAFSLLLFFTAFSLLEAFLPSLVSRTAPSSRKGTALGIYSCSQFLGIFCGGTLGGWLYGTFGLTYVYLFCMVMISVWFAIAFRMKKPQYSH